MYHNPEDYGWLEMHTGYENLDFDDTPAKTNNNNNNKTTEYFWKDKNRNYYKTPKEIDTNHLLNILNYLDNKINKLESCIGFFNTNNWCISCNVENEIKSLVEYFKIKISYYKAKIKEIIKEIIKELENRNYKVDYYNQAKYVRYLKHEEVIEFLKSYKFKNHKHSKAARIIIHALKIPMKPSYKLFKNYY